MQRANFSSSAEGGAAEKKEGVDAAFSPVKIYKNAVAPPWRSYKFFKKIKAKQVSIDEKIY